MRAFEGRNLEEAGRVWSQDERVDALYSEIFQKLLAEMVRNTETVRGGTYLIWVAHNIERMADRVTNIVERVAFIVSGDVETFRDTLRARTLPV
jgi:phosphate transport system protein